MKIQSIEFNGEKNLFTLYIDRKKYQISYDLFEKLKLKKDMELDFSQLEEIIKESNYENIKDKALYYTTYTQRTEKQVRDKIKKLKATIEEEDKIIHEFKKMFLLDDENYAHTFAKQRLSKGESKRKIEQRLYQKGIDKDLRDESLAFITDEDEFENAKKFLNKKFIDKDLRDDKIRQKAYNSLSYRGFSYSIIKKAIGDMYE